MTTTVSQGVRKLAIKTSGGIISTTYVDGDPAAFTYTLSGGQLTAIKGGHRNWFFDTRYQWRIGLTTTADDAWYGWWSSTSFDASPTTVDSGSTFTISWVNAQLSTVVVTGTKDATNSLLTLGLSITLAGTDLSTYAINRVEWPTLSIKPYSVWDKSYQCAAMPTSTGSLLTDATNSSSLLEMEMPNLGVIEPDSTVAAKNAGSVQFCYLYHTGADAGLLIRANDTKLRFKRWTVAGDGDNALFSLLHCPPNNLAATSYTVPFEVELIPQRGGDWYDGARKYQERVESNYAAQQHATWLDRGKIAFREADTFEAIHGLVNLATTAEVTTAKTGLPTWAKLGHYLEEGALEDGGEWPEHSWANSALAADLWSTHEIPSWWYIEALRNDPDAPWYADGEYDPEELPSAPSNYVVLDPDQVAVTSDSYVLWDWAQSAISGLASYVCGVVDSAVTVDGEPVAIGYYFPRLTTTAVQDFRTALTDIQTGTGSATHHDAIQNFLTKRVGAHLGQNAQERHIDGCSGMTQTSGAGMFSTIYSQYVRLWMPSSPSSLDDLYHQFMLGAVPMYSATYLTQWRALVTARANFGHYFAGQRLRPPAACYEREGSGVHASVWRSSERPGQPLGVFLANGSASAASFDLSLGRLDYPEIRENEYLVLTDQTSGARVQKARSLHGASLTISVPAQSLLVYELVSRYDAPGALQLAGGIGALLLSDGTPLFGAWPQYLAQASGEVDELILLADGS